MFKNANLVRTVVSNVRLGSCDDARYTEHMALQAELVFIAWDKDTWHPAYDRPG